MLQKNPGCEIVCNISSVISCVCKDTTAGYPPPPCKLAVFRFTLIGSCDVEQSLSQLKIVLTDKRRSLTIELLVLVAQAITHSS